MAAGAAGVAVRRPPPADPLAGTATHGPRADVFDGRGRSPGGPRVPRRPEFEAHRRRGRCPWSCHRYRSWRSMSRSRSSGPTTSPPERHAAASRSAGGRGGQQARGQREAHAAPVLIDLPAARPASSWTRRPPAAGAARRRAGWRSTGGPRPPAVPAPAAAARRPAGGSARAGAAARPRPSTPWRGRAAGWPTTSLPTSSARSTRGTGAAFSP